MDAMAASDPGEYGIQRLGRHPSREVKCGDNIFCGRIGGNCLTSNQSPGHGPAVAARNMDDRGGMPSIHSASIRVCRDRVTSFISRPAPFRMARSIKSPCALPGGRLYCPVSIVLLRGPLAPEIYLSMSAVTGVAAGFMSWACRFSSAAGVSGVRQVSLSPVRNIVNIQLRNFRATATIAILPSWPRRTQIRW